MLNNIHSNSYYNNEQYLEDENEKCAKIKEEKESDNDKQIDNFLTKDIMNSINFMSSLSENNSPKKKTSGDLLMNDKTEVYEDENDSFQQKSESDNINVINHKELKIEKEITNNYKNNKKEYVINNNKKDKEKNTSKNYFYKSFSYSEIQKDKILNENFESSCASSFFDTSIQHLKEKLENEFSFNSNSNKSYNFLRKNNLNSSSNI